MKQAILITAYKNIHQIMDVINHFPGNFNFYIHIDKKSRVDLKPLKQMGNVFVSKKYTVNWGGLNHLKAILLLADEALKNHGNAFFHLITGEDFPVKSADFFINKVDVSKNYLEVFKMPTEAFGADGGMDRLEYYNLYDHFNAKKRKQERKIRLLLRLQRQLNVRRKYDSEFPKLYGGSTYWSLNRNAVHYVVNYTMHHKALLKRMKYTFCAEEMYFQTLIMNSKHSGHVVNDNLRYIDWHSTRGHPAFLDATDFPNIISSNKLFARKFDITRSNELRQMLTSHLQKQELLDLQ